MTNEQSNQSVKCVKHPYPYCKECFEDFCKGECNLNALLTKGETVR